MFLTTQNVSKYRVFIRWGRMLFALAAFGFVVRLLVRDWSSVTPTLHTIRWWYVVLAFLFFLLFTLIRVFAWQNILETISAKRNGFFTYAKVWTSGELLRFIPGGIWAPIGRVVQTSLTANPLELSLSVGYELVIVLLTGGLLSALSYFVLAQSHNVPLSVAMSIVVVIFFVTLRPIVVRRLLHLGLRIIRRNQDSAAIPLPPVLSEVAILGSFFFFLATHLAFAYALHIPFTMASAASLTAAVMVSWFAGFVIVIAPGGLGVRETVLVALTQATLMTPVAALFSVVSRVAIIVLELAVLGLVMLAARRFPHRDSAHT